MENIVTYKATGEVIVAEFCHLYKFDENDKVKSYQLGRATVNESLS